MLLKIVHHLYAYIRSITCTIFIAITCSYKLSAYKNYWVYQIYLTWTHTKYAYKYQVHVGSSFDYIIPETYTYSRPINSYTFYMYLIYNVYHYI